jgi:type II secretory pathway pseudopilin PulG
MNENVKHKKKGYTFIEIVIVIGIVSITLPIIFSLFFINLRSASRIYALQEVKRNGDIALSSIETFIKGDAAKIITGFGDDTELCTTPLLPLTPTPTPANSMFFKNTHNMNFGFALGGTSGDKIASQSSTGGGTSYLTNDKVKVTNLKFSCQSLSDFSSPSVNVSFTISKKVPTGAPIQDQATLNYSTRIRLRN